MQLDRESCQRARIARDPRFDGCFFIAVKTTRIYCRPICPAPSPKEQNVVYYPSAAAAAEAGYRPCLRCRPEASPGTPGWLGTSVTVSRALRLMSESTLDNSGVEKLAERLGVGSRQLRRLFSNIWALLRLLSPKLGGCILREKADRRNQPAVYGGCDGVRVGSIRRFNFAFQQLYGRTPTELRRLAGKRAINADGAGPLQGCRSGLPTTGTLQSRASAARCRYPCVESCHQELVPADHQVDQRNRTDRSTTRAAPSTCASSFRCSGALPHRGTHTTALRSFGRPCDPNRKLISPRIRCSRRSSRASRIWRVPGAWYPFELAVRAVFQVSRFPVKGASTIADRIAARYGNGGLFPSAEVLATADIEACGVVRSRADHPSLAGSGLEWEQIGNSETFLEQLLALPGIGPWTAQYIAMRASGSPTRFRRRSRPAARGRCRNARNWRSEPRHGVPGAHTRQSIFGKEEG